MDAERNLTVDIAPETNPAVAFGVKGGRDIEGGRTEERESHSA
jgi:hypothetical protein